MMIMMKIIVLGRVIEPKVGVLYDVHITRKRGLCLTLRMEAIRSFETSTNIHQSVLRNIPEDTNL